MAHNIMEMRGIMATIIEFPQHRSRDAILRKHVETMQQAALQAPHPVTESILALLKQIQRTNAAILTYCAESEASSK